MDRRAFLAAMSAAFVARSARAAPQRYGIGPNGARIAYGFVLSGIRQTGTAPLQTADLTIDPQNLAQSQASVTADLRQAKTGFLFITEALKSPAVLDAGTHPVARFTSTKVTLGQAGRMSDGATLDGLLTLRGVTRPIRFAAQLTRPAGSAPNDLRRLSVALNGSLSRAAYGATGFADLVEDRVTLDITADIAAL